MHPDQLAGIVDLARAIARRTAPIPLTLDHVGTFGRAGALWLGPADTTDLCTLQRSVHDAVERSPWPAAFAGRSDPAGWVPHCTLATRLDRVTLERAATLVRTGFVPIAGVVTGLAVLLVGGAGDVGPVVLAAARAVSCGARVDPGGDRPGLW